MNLREDACRLGEFGRRERSLPKTFLADKWPLRDGMYELMGSGYKVSKCQSLRDSLASFVPLST